MSLLLSLFVLISVTGLLVLLNAVHSAPEGHEDEKGFNYDNEAEVNPELCLVPVTRR
jgi:hypothetical protein